MEEFIGYIVKTCIDNGFSLHLEHKVYVSVPGTEIKCSGFFDDQTKQLKVGTDREEDIWLGVLVHEFCHLLQYLDNHPYFEDEIYADEEFDQWLEGKSVDDISEKIKKVRDLELDCEQRSVELIEKFNLPIDVEEYIRMSNAYVLSHNMMEDKKSFITGKVSDLGKDTRLPCEFLENYDTDEYNDVLEVLFERL